MSRFGPDALAFFDTVYQSTAAWDVGGPQPALSALLEEYPPMEPILDVGCGSGDLAIALAQAGRRVVAVDFAEAAIGQALRKASRLPPDVAGRVEFRVADALRPSRLPERFGAVVDSGFLHLFDPDERDRFTEDLASAIEPGGRFYLLAFAITFPIANSPLEVSEQELHERFSAEKGWRILTCRPAEFQSRIAPVPAISACIERLQRHPSPGSP